MFHGKHADTRRLGRVAAWAGFDLTLDQRVKLDRFASWLCEEATVAGGIGPDEPGRVVDRHIADSLAFAGAWTGRPRSALDVGSGVGLPGIPLAITHPDTQFTLLDRSGRRCSLALRAIRILDVRNAEVAHRDVSQLSGQWPVVLFRASLPPDVALAVARPLLEPGGCAIVALSRREAPTSLPVAPPGTSLTVVRTDPGVLDSTAWLLRMEQTEPHPKDGSRP